MCQKGDRCPQKTTVGSRNKPIGSSCCLKDSISDPSRIEICSQIATTLGEKLDSKYPESRASQVTLTAMRVRISGYPLFQRSVPFCRSTQFTLDSWIVNGSARPCLSLVKNPPYFIFMVRDFPKISSKSTEHRKESGNYSTP